MIAVVALALAGAVAASFAWRASGARDSSPLPRLLAVHLDETRPTGEAVNLAAAPGRPVVLNFFASWCDPCSHELPLLAAAHRRLGAGASFVGIDVQDARELAISLLQRAGVTYPAGYDPDHQVSDAYLVGGLPVTVFATADGRIIDYHRGELRAGDLNARLERLMASGPHQQAMVSDGGVASREGAGGRPVGRAVRSPAGSPV